jgi:glycosyltransferase involved in cell wall biosynthesis
VEPSVVRHAGAVAYKLKQLGVMPGTRAFDEVFRRVYNVTGEARSQVARVHGGVRDVTRFPDKVRGAAGPDPARLEPEPRRFRRRRAEIVGYLNTHADRILCVSARVGKVAETFGIDPDLLEVAYIGTPHAQKFADTVPAERLCQPDGTVTLAYLGYMRADKGFFFLLDALEALPPLVARRINLFICARRGPQWAMDRLVALADKFASVRHEDGYTHDNLDALLENVDVGIIPVLWEDNLPQVAIEMHARHIPLITSDLGGARELGNTPAMVFRAGDVESLHEVLLDVIAARIDLDAYWQNARAPTSMEAHAEALRALYRSLLEAPAAAPEQPGAPPEMLQKSQPVPVVPPPDQPGATTFNREGGKPGGSVTALDPGRVSTQKEGLG